ncbi:MAG TPA: hypothetical protein VLK89_02635 [Solirubrobacterales bacterium]|nr:hypothetical protein [Solirubrobacterales bacterium]
MTSNAGTPPRYDLAMVTQVILEEALEIDPQHLTVSELSRRIVTDPDDSREVETATQAIRDLRQSGLFCYSDDDQVVEPTPAALRAYELLA